MSFPLQIPFFACTFRFQDNWEISSPINDLQIIRIGQPLYLLSGRYAEAFQRKSLNKGKFRQILEEYQEAEFFVRKLEVSFPADKNKMMYPAFSIYFDFFQAKRKDGYWAIIPALGLESFANTEKNLEKRLEEAVRLDFSRKYRLDSAQDIASTLWFSQTQIHRQTIDLQMPTIREVEELQQQNEELLLPALAKKISVPEKEQVMYGRSQELQQLTSALKGKFMRNVLLVGPSGVGKTAMVWEIVRQQKKLGYKGDIWETTASTLIKELMRDTAWQDNLAFLCKELSETNDMLFIRNLMELFEVGQYEGNSVSIAEFLKSFLSRGEITIIAECTEEEIARIELKSPNYLSNFTIIRLTTPPEAELEEIILKKVRKIAQNQAVEIEENAIKEVLRLNRRFTPYSGMPGKPIRFLESMLVNKKHWKKAGNKQPNITRSEVIRYFCEDTGMPVFMVDPAIPIALDQVKANFNEQVFGQEEAIDQLVNLLASIKTALSRTGKPIASFLFVGPTGVGKTELAKVLAEFIFGNRDRLVRFDMSEYSSPYAVMRLTGSDYSGDGLLTSAIRKEPFCILLFDEIEKADASFFDLLLQILGEGRLTDSQGKLVNFCSTIIIMTSNIGAQKLGAGKIQLADIASKEEVSHHFLTAVQQYFRPELFNRIEQVIAFEPLDKVTVRFVVDREIEKLKKREGIQYRRLEVHIEDEVLYYLAEKGYGIKYGARQLQRTIREEISIPLAKVLNREEYDEQLVVEIQMKEGKIDMDISLDPLGLELLIEELDKINYADYASNLRRQINELKASSFFVRLLSEIDILERSKKSNKKLKKQSPEKLAQYGHYMEIRNRVEQLNTTINQLELDMSLSCLGLQNYTTELKQGVEEWDNNFFDLKKDIYAQINPSDNSCYIGIYGPDLPIALLYLYRELALQHPFKVELESWWYREGSQDYIQSPIPIEEMDQFHPPVAGAILCGFQLLVEGPCCFLYFNREEGLHRWSEDKKKEQTAWVKVENTPLPYPKKIHIKRNYKLTQYRRIVDPKRVKDILLDINKEYRKDELFPIILEKINQNFKYQIEATLA